MKWEEAMKSLQLKFTSGNDIPVTRASITREEFEALLYAAVDIRIEGKTIGYNEALEHLSKPNQQK
jgi:hypothetical protein